jgi:CBS domain-containing protein
MLVRDIMHPNVYCATVDMPARELYLTLVANGIAGAPVLDAMDYLVGVVSLTDVAACVAGGIGDGHSDYYGRSSHKLSDSHAMSIGDDVKVGDIMSPRIHQVHYDSTVVEALDLMIEESIHRVVVTHRGHVIGILTSGDLMREFRALLVGPEEDEELEEDETEETDEV